MIKTLAVYAASSTQIAPVYFQAARRMGELLAENQIRLLYGAGCIGLMGEIADSVLEHGGSVTGVIPQFMVDEGWHREGLTEMIVTRDMHERKATICDMCDAMLALPGGIGTGEELLEQLTWKQLGLHCKPIVILNTNGFYDPLLQWLDRATDEQFMRPVHRHEMFTVVQQPEDVLPAILHAPQWNTNIRKQAKI